MSERFYGAIYPSRCFVLIGPPASGKSTWRAKQLAATPFIGGDVKPVNPVIVSGDDLIDAEAERLGITYAEAFRLVDFKEQKRVLRETFMEAVTAGRDIIIDRTNLTIKGRRSFLASLPKTYQKVAVLFAVPQDELFERLEKRGRETGKTIPRAVVEDMIASYQPPAHGEFDHTILV